MSASKKRILVTGGAGFLGSNLCDKLVSAGHHVLAIDNFVTGHPDNVEHLLGSPNFELRTHDVADAFDADVDQIFNMACPASPVHYQADPIATMKTCVFGAINMLDLAVRRRARILQASTSEVYGDPAVHPQVEAYWGNVNPNGIRACYDEGKRCAEALFFDYGRQKGVGIKVARIFNTYGPRMHPEDGRAISNFVVQALRGEDLTVYGEGLQTRSFCYVDDLLDGLVRLMDSPAALTGPVNLGNPVECTVGDLARLVIELTGSRSRIVHRPLPADDPRQRRPDIGLAHSALGWSPQIGLREGLAKTIAYLDAHLAGEATQRRSPRSLGTPAWSSTPN